MGTGYAQSTWLRHRASCRGAEPQYHQKVNNKFSCILCETVYRNANSCNIHIYTGSIASFRKLLLRSEVERLTYPDSTEHAIIDHQWWGDNSTTTPFYDCWGPVTSCGIVIDPELPSPNATYIPSKRSYSTPHPPHHPPSISLPLPHRPRR